MADQHPLTDAKCREIANNLCLRWPPCIDQGEVLYGEDDLRAAADWQLEQVIKCLKDYTKSVEFRYHPQYVATRLKEAMRPTQENNND